MVKLISDQRDETKKEHVAASKLSASAELRRDAYEKQVIKFGKLRTAARINYDKKNAGAKAAHKKAADFTNFLKKNNNNDW